MKYVQNIYNKGDKQKFGKLLQLFDVVYCLTFPSFGM